MKKGIKVLLLSDTWATLGLGMIGPIYAIFVENIGGDILDASWAYFAFLISSGIVMYLISHWEDRVKHKERLITLGYCLASLGALSYYFVDSQLTLVMTQIILGLSEAVLVPAYDALYSKYLTKHNVASEWGNWESMRYIVTAGSVLIGGYLAYHFGFKFLFLVMFGISLLSVFSSLYLYKGKKFLSKV
ncbi:MFS transporter [archaeon]|jgi:predicted MFS family arabinose efflux permease|nr:MFS transporter [archaeon]MBT3451638.1 MFS transporter [archaeon]MBT6869659.1 MFS transporter [archaeon]MBT7192427.1 MFS transporter [archaeon]MBT7380228.1 MFS transporter [archaeon]